MRLFLTFVISILLTSCQGPPEILDASASPSVVAHGDEFLYYLRIDKNDIDSILVNGNTLFRLNDKTVTELMLYDDASHGDLVAGDRIFTIGGLKHIGPLTNNIRAGEFIRMADISFFSSSGIELQTMDLGSFFGTYYKNEIDPAEVFVINDTLQYSKYTINLKRPNIFLKSPYPDLEYWQNSDIFKKFFCDNFMFLIENTTNNDFRNSAGTFKASQLNPLGIGKNKKSFDFGYPARGIMSSTGIGYFYSFATHESLHYWCASQDLKSDIALGHWKYIKMQSSGLMGSTSKEYNSIKSLNQDTFEVWLNYKNNKDKQWSNLELYMAGILPIDSVPFPLEYLDKGEILGPITQNPNLIKGDLRYISKNKWLADEGVRIPQYGPSKYSVVQIVYSDELLNPAQMAFFDEGMRLAMLKENGSNIKSLRELTDDKLKYTNGLKLRDEEFGCLDIIELDIDDLDRYSCYTLPVRLGCEVIDCCAGCPKSESVELKLKMEGNFLENIRVEHQLGWVYEDYFLKNEEELVLTLPASKINRPSFIQVSMECSKSKIFDRIQLISDETELFSRVTIEQFINDTRVASCTKLFRITLANN